jgi:hypothetical protein
MYSHAPADAKLVLNEKTYKEKLFKILIFNVPILMGIYLFLNPFPHTTAIKEISFYTSVMIVILLVFT